eukprot:XP_001694065.1 predicted protein [Chlamydomonas reinhardtii]
MRLRVEARRHGASSWLSLFALALLALRSTVFAAEQGSSSSGSSEGPVSSSNGAVVSAKVPSTFYFTSRTINTTITVTPGEAPASSSPGLAPAQQVQLALSWEASPACDSAPTTFNSVADIQGRLWGRLVNASAAVSGSASCAFKDAASQQPVFSWETAPRCPASPSLFASVADGKGRLWGTLPGGSSVPCAFKAADSDRPLYDFLTAPACVSLPEIVTCEADAAGRLWGWESGRECAFKDYNNNPLSLPLGAADLSNVHPVTPEEMVARNATTALPRYDWVTAPRCLSDAADNNTHADGDGRLWGWEAGSSCAFKDLQQRPLRTWATALPCPAAPQLTTAVPDASGRLWGWLAGGIDFSCAFKDAMGAPLSFNPINTSAPTTASGTPSSSSGPTSSGTGGSSATDSGVEPTVQIINAGSLAAGAYLAATQQSGDPNAAEAAAHSSSASAGGSIGSPHADSATPFANSGHRRSALGAWGPHLRGGDAAASRHARHQHQQPQKQAYDAGGSMAFHTGHSSLAQSSELGRADQGSGSRRAAEVQQQPEPQVHHRYRRSLGQDTDPATSGYPSCSVYPAPSGVRQDSAGRLWSSEGGKSCVYRTSDGRSAAWFDVAPACAADPSDANIHSTDAQGRRWGWENARSCAFRDAKGQPRAKQEQVSAAAGSQQPDAWSAAPACTNARTSTNSKTDSAGRWPDNVGYVWGWENGRGCVFRNSEGMPVYYAALITGDMSAQPGYVPKVASAQAWYDAPRCSSPPDWSSAQPDSEGRLWGTEAGTGTCVFRDQRGYPLFYSDLQNGNVAEYYNAGSKWDNAPACPDSPTWSSARADNYGRLWGWDSAAGSSCAYKDASGAAVYPPKGASR